MTDEKQAPQERKFDPTVLQRAFDRTTQTGPDAMQGGEIIPRRRITFEFSSEICAPGIFDNPDGSYATLQMTLAGLTASMEVKVTKGLLDPLETVQMTAKASVEELNGAPVPPDQVEWLWEALGPGGRQLVLTMFQEIGSLTPAAMGKAQATSIVR